MFKTRATCIREVENWSSYENAHRLDHASFNPARVQKNLEIWAPKMAALMKKIEQLDHDDMKRDGHLYKHLIFSDLKTNGGAKSIASALLSNGYSLIYDASLSLKSNLPKTKKNFVLLTSTKIYQKAIGVRFRRKVLDLFNARPDNVYGQDVRFLILDSGFKEGIDVFDIRYIHILETPITSADQKQIIGRGTRFCGQKGLKFDSKHGWPLFVYKYRTTVPDSLKDTYEADTLYDIFLRNSNLNPALITFGKELDEKVIQASVDLQLNAPIHAVQKDFKDIYDKALRDYPSPMAISPAKEEITVKYGVKMEKHGPINCKNGCKGNVLAMPVPFMLIVWYMSKKANLIQDKRPKAFLCEKIIKDSDYCKRLSSAWHRPDIYILKNEKRIYERLKAIPNREPFRTQKEEMLRYVRIRLEAIQLPPEPPTREMSYEQLQDYISKRFKKFKWETPKVENQCVEKVADPQKGELTFTPSQDFVRHYFQPASVYKGMLLWHSTGSGKCHAKDTPIIMYDGTIKMVQDINVGDLLMGDDSTPRKVLSLASGYDDMYDIIPIKGEKYRVNSEHILCLKPTGYSIAKNNKGTYSAYYFQKNGKLTNKSFKTAAEAQAFNDGTCINKPIIEIPVKDYIHLSKTSKHGLKGYRVGIEFPEQPLPIDPHLFGIWLGDGGSRDPKITTADPEILEYVKTEIEKMGLRLNQESKYDYRISIDGKSKVGGNKFTNFMKNYNLIKNKHIPHIFLANSRENRLKLLAGIIDTDGYYNKCCYEITQKSDKITDGILYLARSLGFAAYNKKCEKSCMYNGEKRTGIYNRIHISGNIDEIPVLLPRKKACERKQKKNVLVTGINVEHVGRDKYYGFTLDGNNRYLLGDFTVTHNTCSAIATATTSFEKEGYTILWVTRHTLKSDLWKNVFQQICSIALRENMPADFSLSTALKNPLKYLSDRWMMPLTYKQFSNMLLKRNQFYKEMVKRNGEKDPLKKTILIIDEAHKLLSEDLLPQERPDFKILQKEIQHSYKESGKDSVRVLLMSATPYTNDPMNFIKILNLLRESKFFPETFAEFQKDFLTKEGTFKDPYTFVNQVSGYVSYLNREKDIRQFAIPIIKSIEVPMSESSLPEVKEKLDKVQELYKQAQKDLDHYKDVKKRGREKLKKERILLEDRCKEIEDRKEKRECKEAIPQKLEQFKNFLFKEANKAIEENEEKMKQLKPLVVTTQKEFKELKENDLSQERILTEKCFKQKLA